MADGDLPTFSEIPEFVFTRKDRYICLKSNWTEGMILRRAVTPTKTRVFILIWKNANQTIKDTIMDFYEGRIGSAGAFWYTPIDESSPIKVRFSDELPVCNKNNYNNYSIQINFIELL